MTYVIRGGTAAEAGLRAGDLIDTRAFSPVERYRFFAGSIAKQPTSLPVIRGRKKLTVTYVSLRWYIPWHAWFFIVGTLWALLFATLLAWRLPDNREARILCVLLVFVFGNQMIALGNLELPSVRLEFAANLLAQVFNNAGWPLLATYALLFARPPSTLRRTLGILSYVVASLAFAWSVAWLVVIWTGVTDPANPVFNGPFADGFNAAEMLLPLLCALATVPALRGAERTRFTWTLLTVGFFYAAYLVTTLLNLVPQFAYGLGLVQIQTVCTFIAPLGMTYALLSRRLLDVGFVLNRAAVFTAVSVVVVGAFVLAEWALSEWFSSASHTTNLAISAALALALGLSVRAIHSRVDRVLDAIFFRKRHEDEQAIRTLAREAAYITDPQILLSRTISALEKHAGATSVNVLLDNGNTYDRVIPSPSTALRSLSGHVGENDPAIVRLRATSKVLDLHNVETAIRGEYAYPMVARGRLVGAIVLGLKGNGESYAPDESDAIAQLAHDVGSALDVLMMRKESEEESVLEAIRALPQRLIEALDIRERLSQADLGPE